MGGSTTGNAVLQTHAADIEDRGLQFTNDEWNGSIANGQPIMLRWNESIKSGEMRLFKVSYPVNGVVALEPLANWTEHVDGTEYLWTPEGLDEDELYALRIAKRGAVGSQWGMSPPWKLDEEKEPYTFRWSNPVGIPIVVILAIYFISLFTCLMYRRRKRLRLEAQQNCIQVCEEAAPLPDNVARHGSVSSSVVTVETLTEEDGLVEKAEPIFILDEGLRFQSDDGYQSTETTLVDEPREESPEQEERGRICECGGEPRAQFYQNDFESDDRIGQAR